MARMERTFCSSVVEDEEVVGSEGDDSDDDEEAVGVRRRMSRLDVGGGGGGEKEDAGGGEATRSRRGSRFAAVDGGVQRRRDGCAGTALPPPHAWLAVEDAAGKKGYGSDTEEQWTDLLRRGSAPAPAPQKPRRSSFCGVRRECGARDAWLDRAWELKKSWHERSSGSGTPDDADTPVVVVVAAAAAGGGSSSTSSSRHHHAAMDMDEVRACRDLGLQLPSDCTVEIQCYGLSGAGRSRAAHSSAAAGSPSACSGTGEDPVKAKLKEWAQAVALASTTHSLAN